MEMPQEKIAEMVEFIGLADDIMTSQQEKIASLEEALNAANQKEASVQASVLDADAIKQTVSNIISAGFLKKADQDQAISAIERDPANLLEFVDKLATETIKNRQARPMGRPVQKTASAHSKRESDASFEATFSRIGNQL
jgi:hypothetical protein